MRRSLSAGVFASFAPAAGFPKTAISVAWRSVLRGWIRPRAGGVCAPSAQGRL